jgi:multiple RNA-binding domain-containing protein 1
MVGHHHPLQEYPLRTTQDQIGELVHEIVPPAGTMAVAEFGRVDEAAKVFRAVAYRWLGNSVIYLEKGPSGMFTEDAGSIEARTVFSSSALPAVKVPEQMAEDIADQDEEPPSVAGGSTLYVKNISFATTEQRFENVFRNLPSFSFARIQTKPDPKRPDGR